MGTSKLYLEDTDRVEAEATVEEINKGELESEQSSIVLDATVFSPQGGGQPSDEGVIEGEFGCFKVEKVRFDGEKIVHYGTGDLPLEKGVVVKLMVDKEKRSLFSRLHSAGHALDRAMANLGYPSDRLKATKGYHFPDGPSVEYEIVGAPPTPEEMASLPSSLTTEMLSLVEANIDTEVIQDISKAEAIETTDLTESDLKGYPERLRLVKIAGTFLPCSGTHVKSSGMIGPVTVTRAKKKKNTLKISYTL
jgi:Ser-tRNA(Ala) deacylase AlaX